MGHSLQRHSCEWFNQSINQKAWKRKLDFHSVQRLFSTNGGSVTGWGQDGVWTISLLILIVTLSFGDLLGNLEDSLQIIYWAFFIFEKKSVSVNKSFSSSFQKLSFRPLFLVVKSHPPIMQHVHFNCSSWNVFVWNESSTLQKIYWTIFL